MKGRKGPPEHLSPDMVAFFRSVMRTYALAEHHRRLLVAACEAHDRMEQARKLLAAEGVTTADRHGQLRPHPAIAIERDSRTSFARLIRELGLSDSAPDDTRPPRLSGRYTGRA